MKVLVPYHTARMEPPLWYEIHSSGSIITLGRCRRLPFH